MSVRIILLIQACVAALREVLGPLVPEDAILQVGLLALNPEHPYLSQSIFWILWYFGCFFILIQNHFIVLYLELQLF